MRWWRRKRAAEEAAGAEAAAESAPRSDDRDGRDAESGTGTDGTASEQGENRQEQADADASTGVALGDGTLAGALAERVHAVLSAAEQSAASIRRDAETARLEQDHRAREATEAELKHLERLAGSLVVQADAVGRQCAVVREVVTDPKPREDPDGNPSSPPAATGGVLGPEGRGARLDRPGLVGRTQTSPSESVQRIDVYRMRLAGASDDEVEAHLRRHGGVPGEGGS